MLLTIQHAELSIASVFIHPPFRANSILPGWVKARLAPSPIILHLSLLASTRTRSFPLSPVSSWVSLVATKETHEDTGDRGNDLVRVDASKLRCKIIGEGANLALTQPGRIEFALNGGCINTDAIDNSAC